MIPSMKRKVMVTLDSLLDVRMGLLYTIDADASVRLAESVLYFEREADVFRLDQRIISPEELYRVMPARKADILPFCSRTPMWRFVVELLVSMMNTNTAGGHFDIGLEINTFPYVLTPEENRVLTEVMTEISHNLFSVEVSCVPHASLTPEIVGEHYLAMVMYDPTQWFNLHEREMFKAKTAAVKLYVPKTHKVRELTPEENVELRKHGMTLFDAMRVLVEPIISMRFIPTRLFSLECPANPA
jgi:hypothetical protein